MRSHRPLLLGALAIGAALLLTGCLDAGFPGDSPTTRVPTSATTAPAAPTTTVPTEAPTPEPTTAPASPVALDCAALLPIGDLYEIDPNLSIVPVTGSPSTWLAQEAIAADGTVCQATHATSGATAFLGISAPGAAALAEQLAAAGPGSPLGSTGVDAHGEPNQLQVFRGERRITGECDPSFNPDSLRALLETAIANGA